MSATETKGNQSVGKALKIIEILAESPQPMRLMDIAAQVKMPSSTTLRMIATLMDYNYIAQDSTSQRYFLTLKFARIGALAASRFSLQSIAHPYLSRLTAECGEATCVAIDSDMAALYIDVVDGPGGMLKIMQHIGKISPLHCTGVGKCLLLNYSEAQIDEYIAAKGLPTFTANTITGKAALLAELQAIRERGYALDNEECELGARCIAAGISDADGKIAAAISISGPVNRMTDERIEKISAALMQAAQDIGRLL